MNILNVKVKSSNKNINLGLSFIFMFYSEDENGIFIKLYTIKCRKTLRKKARNVFRCGLFPLWSQLLSPWKQTFVIKSKTFPLSTL